MNFPQPIFHDGQPLFNATEVANYLDVFNGSVVYDKVGTESRTKLGGKVHLTEAGLLVSLGHLGESLKNGKAQKATALAQHIQLSRQATAGLETQYATELPTELAGGGTKSATEFETQLVLPPTKLPTELAGGGTKSGTEFETQLVLPPTKLPTKPIAPPTKSATKLPTELAGQLSGDVATLNLAEWKLGKSFSTALVKVGYLFSVCFESLAATYVLYLALVVGEAWMQADLFRLVAGMSFGTMFTAVMGVQLAAVFAQGSGIYTKGGRRVSWATIVLTLLLAYNVGMTVGRMFHAYIVPLRWWHEPEYWIRAGFSTIYPTIMALLGHLIAQRRAAMMGKQP